jgi:hypothetical protein
VPEELTPQGRTVKQVKDWAKEEGYTESEMKEAFGKVYRDTAAAVWESDDVKLHDISTAESLKERGGRVGRMDTTDPTTMRHRLVAEGFKPDVLRWERDIGSATKTREVSYEEIQRYAGPKERAWIEESDPRTLKEIEKLGGFRPPEDIKYLYAREVAVPETVARYRDIATRSEARKTTEEWKKRAKVYEDLKSRQSMAYLIRGAHDKLLDGTDVPRGSTLPWLPRGWGGSMAGLHATAQSEFEGLIHGLSLFSLESIDHIVGFDDEYTRASYAETMTPEQLGMFVKRAEDLFGGIKNMPKEMVEAIRANKIRIARFPKFKEDMVRGEREYEAAKGLVRKDFDAIMAEDPGFFSAAISDTADILLGLVHLATGAVGSHDSPYVNEAYEKGDYQEYYRRRLEERTEFYRNLGHTALGAVAVLFEADADATDIERVGAFAAKFEARPVTTFMTIMPILRLIKVGAIGPAMNTKAGIRARAMATKVLDRWENPIKRRLGDERYAKMVNTMDKVVHPLRSLSRGAKSFIADRAVQVVNRATDLMRDLFDQPIKTRAENAARMRRGRVKWEAMKKWRNKQPDIMAPELIEVWSTKLDDLMSIFPDEERVAIINSLSSKMHPPLDLPDVPGGRQADAMARVPELDEMSAARLKKRGYSDEQIAFMRRKPEPGPEDISRDAATSAAPDPAVAAHVAEQIRLGKELMPNEAQYRKNHPQSVEEALMSGATPREPIFADAGMKPEFGTVGAFEVFEPGGPPIRKTYFRPREKGEKGAATRMPDDERVSLAEVFERETDRATSYYDSEIGRLVPGRRRDLGEAYKHMEGEALRAIAKDDPAAVPRDFVEPITHLDPTDVRVTFMQTLARQIPEGPVGNAVWEAVVKTDAEYAGFRKMDPQILGFLEYGMPGYRRGKGGRGPVDTFRTLPGGAKLDFWVHPAVEQTMYALSKFMLDRGLSTAALKGMSTQARRAAFNKAMGSFRKKHTWDRSALPDKVNQMLDSIVNAQHPKYVRQQGKSSFLKEHAPAGSFAEWARKYHPKKDLDAIPKDNVTPIPKGVRDDPTLLGRWLEENPPGIAQYLAQRGLAGKRNAKDYKKWLTEEWTEESHTQLVNYARWADEGPRTTDGKKIAYQEMGEGVTRRYPDKRVYGRDFEPYVEMKKLKPEDPTVTPPIAKSYLETDVPLPEGPSRLQQAVMADAMVEGRKITNQSIKDTAALHNLQKEMARLMRDPDGEDAAAALFSKELENVYQNKLNNTAMETVADELAYSREFITRKADDLAIEDLPGALHLAPDEFLAQFKPTTAKGRLWKDMATRRLRKSTFYGGYVKVPEPMMRKLKLSGEIYMPRSAVRQWRWQRDALDQMFGASGFWAKFTTYVKANLTATNLPTLIYNTVSNIGMQTLTRGPMFFKEFTQWNLQYRQFLKGKKFDSEMQGIFEAIEENGILSTDFHRMELQFLAEGIPDFRKKAIQMKGPTDYLKDIVMMRPISKFYGGTDNTFKLHEAVFVMKRARQQLRQLKKPGQFLAFPTAPGRYARFTTKTVGGKRQLFSNGKQLKSQKEMWGELAKYGRMLGDLKFFDYSNLPGWNAVLRGRKLDLLFSPFLSFTSKALWLPGFKRGLARELLGEVPVRTNIPQVKITQAAQAMETYGIWSASIAQSRADFVEGAEDLAMTQRFNPLSRHMMIVDWIKNPGTVWVKDLRALDFLEGTQILATLIDHLFGVGKPHVRAFGSDAGPEELRYTKSGHERPEKDRDMLETEWQEVIEAFPFSGVNADDFLNQIGAGRGPVLDMLMESERIGSTWWGHQEFTPKNAYQTYIPPLIPGTLGKAIDVAAGLINEDSPMTSRRQAKEHTYGQVGETEAEFARRKMTGLGMVSRPVKTSIEAFFRNMKREWKARAVGTPATHGSLKWKMETAKDRGEFKEAAALKKQIATRNQLINWSIAERKEKAYGVLKGELIKGTLRRYGQRK